MGNRGKQNSFSRRKPRIEPRYTVYIICEGEKTEYIYFKAIKKARRLSNIRIDIDPGTRSGSDPVNLIEYAKNKKIQEEYDDTVRKRRNTQCVFDDDGRQYINQVLLDASKRPKVEVAFSNPCFELWYYLHYDYSTGAFTQSQMIERLKALIPDYTKDRNVFDMLPDRATAMERAEELRQHHASVGSKLTDNPSTSVDKLVELLYSLDDSR